jgi:AcrR family transcriptional regulator
MTTRCDDHIGEPGLRERKKQQTRRAIHEAAYRLIDEQGVDATTVEQICRAAEVSGRTFFNYFPSKAAAALALPVDIISEETRARFLASRGGLVWELCDVVGSGAEFTPDHARIKSLLVRHPELLSTLSGTMIELRSQFVALAAERAASQEQAELAVALVMAALGRGIRDESSAPLVIRLRRTVDQLAAVAGEGMSRPQSRS